MKTKTVVEVVKMFSKHLTCGSIDPQVVKRGIPMKPGPTKPDQKNKGLPGPKHPDEQIHSLRAEALLLFEDQLFDNDSQVFVVVLPNDNATPNMNAEDAHFCE